MADLKTGKKLENGAIVVLADKLRPVGDTKMESTIILGKVEETGEYVTWVYIHPHAAGKRPYCVSGSYHDNVEDGLIDFLDRTKTLQRFKNRISRHGL